METPSSSAAGPSGLSAGIVPTLYEISVRGRAGLALPELDVPETPLPDYLLREDNGLPELSELDVVRHYLRLAQRNFGVDSGFYPLGSCTMKYNPKICEEMARLPTLFARAEPGESVFQAALQKFFAGNFDHSTPNRLW
jgi:glycine cleavage system P protein (glycine dehydrogenase) subunit 2